jgi:FAD:protein FMN transferase
MGTVVSFLLRVESPSKTTTDAERAAAEALERAQARLRRIDDVFSTFKPQSAVSRLRRGEIELDETPPEVAEVLELCRTARRASDGWFDPWALPGGVDPTGLVKGWAAERALDEFKAAGLPGAMVNAGGDIAVYGEPETGQSWRLGVRHPLAPDRLLLVAEISGRGAIATSGTYERGEHLLNPKTGRPATKLLSATVIGLDLAYADALATAVFVSDGELLERVGELRGYHAVVVDRDGGLRASRGFPITLRTAA